MAIGDYAGLLKIAKKDILIKNRMINCSFALQGSV